MPTVRSVTHDLLRALGMTTVFGNPGSTELPFLTDWPADFTYIPALQEASATSMADGYAQSSDRPALVNLHTGPGLGNAMGAIEAAYYNATPLVVTAGQQVRAMIAMRALLTNDAPGALASPYVKKTLEPARPQDVPVLLQQAYHLAMTAPRGPVLVSIPMDDWDAECEPVAPRRVIGYRSAPDPDLLRELAGALAGAERPALVIGAGVDASGGWDDAVAVAERLAATVYLAPNSSRIAFPTDHPLYAGELGLALAPVAEKLARHDVVLVAGAQVFLYYPYVPGPVVPAGTRLLHVTDDPLQLARAADSESLLADPALTLRALLGELPESPTAAPPEPAPQPKPATAPLGDAPMTADYLFSCLAEAMPAGTVVVEESTSNRPELRSRVKVRRPRGYLTTGSGGLGFGLPAAVGVALAEQQRDTEGSPVCCVIGDGSLHYSVQALYTASRFEIPLVVVVPRNRSYTILESFASFEHVGASAGQELPGLDLPDAIDHGLVARGYGCGVVEIPAGDPTVEQLGATLAAAFATARHERRPVVVVADIDAAVPELL
jgi:benzoylformate decarboxylase